MNTLIRIKSLWIALMLVSAVFSQSTNRALLMGIGDYPENPSLNQTWPDLSSMNDLKILQVSLRNIGFESKNIITLSNEQVTVDNIKKTFDSLILVSHEGDNIYVHFSGHGQQVTDASGNWLNRKNCDVDERDDGFDEVLVTYYAPVSYYEGYKLEHHLLDDELGYYLNRLSEKIGPKGQIVFANDACHSGTGTRAIAIQTELKRGEDAPIILPFTQDNQEEKIISFGGQERYLESEKNNILYISGCKSGETNSEYRKYGSLSFAMNQIFESLDSSVTFGRFDALIRAQYFHMDINSQKQNPQIEGVNHLNSSRVLFSNQNKKSHEYFSLDTIIKADIILNGGVIDGLNEGDSIEFRKIINENNVSIKGVIDKAETIKSRVKLNKDIFILTLNPSTFLARRFYKNNTKGFIDVEINIKDRKFRKYTKKQLKLNSSIHLKSESPRLIISDTAVGGINSWKLQYSNNQQFILFNDTLSYLKNDNQKNIDELIDKILTVMEVDAFRRYEHVGTTTDFDLFKGIDESQFDEITRIPRASSVSSIQKFSIKLKNSNEGYLYIFDITNNQIKDSNIGKISNIFPLQPKSEMSNTQVYKFVISTEKINFDRILGKAQQVQSNTRYIQSSFTDNDVTIKNYIFYKFEK